MTEERIEYEQVVAEATLATERLMDAVIRAKEFQGSVKDGGRAYEKAGFKKWVDCERFIANTGFKQAPADFKRLLRDAKLFHSDLVRKFGPSKLKAAARLKRAGRWNEEWEGRFLNLNTEAALIHARDELRKVLEDQKWVRMLLPKSLVESWDVFRERIKKVLSFETEEQVLDWVMGFWSDVPDEEIVFLTEHGFGAAIEEAGT